MDAEEERPAARKSVLGRIVNATRYSMEGLAAAYRHEDSFRQEVWAAAVLLPLACWLGATGAERALLIGAVMLVLVVELLNSAVEAVVDRVSFENHPLAKRAKDVGSAAVCLSLVNLAAVWLAVLLG